MVSNQPDRLPTVAHRDQLQPATVRSALHNRNTPRRRCTQQVRFKDLEEEGGVAPGGRTVPERHRLGAGPGSPHPNRKSPPGPANSRSVVGAVWEDMVGTVDSVAAILARVPRHTLTPGPTRRTLATPLSVTRTYSHSLEDIIGMERPVGGAERATPNHLPCTAAAQLFCHTHSRLPNREGPFLQGERQQNTISPPLPQIDTDCSARLPETMVTGFNGSTQSRRQQQGSALSDPRNKDPPCSAPLLSTPPLPPPPPPYCSPNRFSYHTPPMPCPPRTPPMPRPPRTPPMPRPPRTPPMPRPPRTPPMSRPPHTPPMPRPNSKPPAPIKVAPQGASEREKREERIKNTLNPAPNPNPTLHQQPCDPCGTTEPPLTPDQAQTLREVERLLGALGTGDRGSEGPKGELLGPQGPLSDVRGLKSRLQSLEGLLETSHNTIRRLLHAIQDLEVNDGQSERRTSYKTSQKMKGHRTSTDNACVIYSVENDFRLQEGSFTQSWMKVDSLISAHSSSPPPNSNPRQEESSLPAPPPFSDRPPHTDRRPRPAKKSRRKCFWFL